MNTNAHDQHGFTLQASRLTLRNVRTRTYTYHPLDIEVMEDTASSWRLHYKGSRACTSHPEYTQRVENRYGQGCWIARFALAEESLGIERGDRKRKVLGSKLIVFFPLQVSVPLASIAYHRVIACPYPPFVRSTSTRYHTHSSFFGLFLVAHNERRGFDESLDILTVDPTEAGIHKL
ncbi:hypothetical protein GY45DRAFT_456612 [Cubamyces sp. BRFM 1775]|nr:hypothetical protein GY45DRAFT_456612 [Cubamyces sp. BRFM 1775]